MWFADILLQHYPGTDIALINGLIHVIVKEKLYDEDFVRRRCVGFEEVVKTVEKFTPEYVEELTGVPAELIVEAARTFATAGKGVITWAMGITQHTHGHDNVRLLATLSAICGYQGREGCGVSPMRGQNNVQGACDLGALPNFFPGYKKVTDEHSVEFFKDFWSVDYLSDKASNRFQPPRILL